VRQKFEELDFVPFDPISKRTQATIRGPDGKVFKCMKGAPQVVLPMCEYNAELEQKVSIAVQELADR
jgi:H+-transporting ATPase